MKYSFNLFVKICLISFLAILILFTSCRSNKDLTYMQDTNAQERIKSLSPSAPVYKVKLGDNLFVSVLSSNPEMNKLYNPAFSNSASGTIPNQMYDELTGQYIYGYEVDQEGAIMLPLLGKVHVFGKTLAEA